MALASVLVTTPGYGLIFIKSTLQRWSH